MRLALSVTKVAAKAAAARMPPERMIALTEIITKFGPILKDLRKEIKTPVMYQHPTNYLALIVLLERQIEKWFELARHEPKMNSIRTALRSSTPNIFNCTSSSDMPRLNRIRRSLREGMKPSRWYDDDPAKTSSLFRLRLEATADLMRDAIAHSPDKALVDSAKAMLIDFRDSLPKTFAVWAGKHKVNVDLFSRG